MAETNGTNGTIDWDGDKPLIVFGTSRQVCAVRRIDAKGVRKSLEHNQLWVLHAETGRLLPFGDETLTSIEDRGEWVEAVVGAGVDATGGRSPAEFPARTPTGRSSRSERTDATILTELAAVVADRNRTRPEGSYTTYLFEQGAGKIRKKTGEEAIELVLAGTVAEIVSEAADLIYHLLVLFEAEGIEIGALFDKLAERRS